MSGLIPVRSFQGSSTDDPTPTLRISVQETGTLQVSGGTWIAVTAADVSRGYAEVELSLADGPHRGTVQLRDANGLLSYQTDFSVQVDTTPYPSPGSVSISDVTITEGQSGTQVANFTVTRTGGTAAFSVNYGTTADSASAAGGDYVATSGTLQFGAGVNSQTVSVTINGDSKFEPTETFFVNLSGATNGATISDSQAVGTISNDDANHAPVVTAPDRTMSSGQSIAATALFTASDIDDQAMTRYAFWDGTSAEQLRPILHQRHSAACRPVELPLASGAVTNGFRRRQRIGCSLRQRVRRFCVGGL